MKRDREGAEGISAYVTDKEHTANKYVLRCFSVSILIYTIAYILNLLGIFIVDQKVMGTGFWASLMVYLIAMIITRFISLSNEKSKYFVLLAVIIVYTIMGMYITYHVVLVSVLPFLYAILYSSKRVMRYVYGLTVVSTVFVVYGGYYFGLCDANMALLTVNSLQGHIIDGKFALSEINANPIMTLGLYYLGPRCLIYIAFMVVCNNIFEIVNGSLEKAQLTSELEKAKIAAEKANRAKTDFLTKMSHEIRTPINAVLGIDEMILRESKESETKKYALDIKSSAKSLLSIINEILDSSKIESGKMEIIPDNYNIGSVLNDLYNMIRIKAQDKGLKLIFDIDPAMPTEYFGDDVRIRQVLTNLLTNAVKYTPEGTVTMTVTSRIEGANAILCCSVKDTGIGIKEEDISKLFSEYQRIEEERNRYIEGTGLGMTITVQLLKLMGSNLKVQSEYGKGSEFSFELKQKIVNAEPFGEFEEKIHEAEADYDYQVSYTAPEAKILVVDDNGLNHKVFKSLLKQTQVQIYDAMSGKAGIEMLEKQAFDIVFLDHMMPELDGIETLHIMHERKLCDNIPVIMLTANAIIGAKEGYLKEGFDDYLTKPIVPTKLEKIIKDYLPQELVKESVLKEEAVSAEPAEELLPQLEEFDFGYARSILRSEELLRTTLKDFYHSLDGVCQKLSVLLERLEQDETIQNYRIEVHALKSTSATVGAMLLSKVARLLEVAAIEKNPERIRTLHPILMEEVKKHKERIATILPPEEEKLPIEDIGEITAYLEKLKTGLENEDYDTADSVCEELQRYQYEEEVQVLVDELAQRILNLETEEALERINIIRNAVEDKK